MSHRTTRTVVAATLMVAFTATASACSSRSTVEGLPDATRTVTATTTGPAEVTAAEPAGARPAVAGTSAPSAQRTGAQHGATTHTRRATSSATPTTRSGPGLSSRATAPTADAHSPIPPAASATSARETSDAQTAGPSAAKTPPTAVAAPVDEQPRFSGESMNHSGAGYGQVRPREIYFGGDPTGHVFDITWETWGGRTAVGHGTGYYLAPGQSTSRAAAAPAIVRLSKIGTCDGHRAYQSVVWWYPTKGETGPDPEFPATVYTACQG